jgi:hypothetical protein
MADIPFGLHSLHCQSWSRFVIRRGAGQPIWEAYADADLSHPCPNCHAAPDVWCARPDGRVRRTPCLARIETLNPKVHP